MAGVNQSNTFERSNRLTLGAVIRWPPCKNLKCKTMGKYYCKICKQVIARESNQEWLREICSTTNQEVLLINQDKNNGKKRRTGLANRS